MTCVLIGTPNAAATDAGAAVVRIEPPDDVRPSEFLTILADLWTRHSTAPPAWVEADRPELADAVAGEYAIPVGRPDGWQGAGDELSIEEG